MRGDMVQLNTDIVQLNTDIVQLNTDIVQLNTDLQLNTYICKENKQANNQNPTPARLSSRSPISVLLSSASTITLTIHFR